MARVQGCAPCFGVRVLCAVFAVFRVGVWFGLWCVCWDESDDDLLSRGWSSVSSALPCFTVLFGMGRRGAKALWSSDSKSV